MKERDYFKQVQKDYEVINNKWLNLHFHLLVACAITSIIIEMIMYFVIKQIGQLNCTPMQYWLIYIITPALLIIAIVVSSFLIIKKRTLSVGFKQYSIAILFSLFAVVISMVHSFFVSSLVCAIFPILFTIMYENQRLTLIVAVISALQQAVNGYLVYWDSDKVMTDVYAIDIAILIVMTFFVWYSSYLMIKFSKKKREIILNNDIERFKLQDQIVIDTLTGVGNKLALKNQMELPISDGHHVSYIAMFDIDGFKLVNDRFGHVFGDEVLRCVGKAMINLETNASSYRYGGDEFCVIFREPSLNSILRDAEAIQQYIFDNLEYPAERVEIMMSVGISKYVSGKSWSELLEQADVALYEAKKKPQGRIVVYDQFVSQKNKE